MTPEATIYYTTDGTEPSREKTQYSNAISISGKAQGENATVKAIAVKEGMQDSEVMEITYINSYVQAQTMAAKSKARTAKKASE